MKVCKYLIKIMVFVIIPLFLFQNFLFLYVSPIKQDENYYIKYSDVSFNLDIEEEQQYHFDDLSHNLELSFSFPSLEEKGVISIELKIQTTISSNNNSNFEIKKNTILIQTQLRYITYKIIRILESCRFF